MTSWVYLALIPAAALPAKNRGYTQNIPELPLNQKLFCHPLCNILSTFSTEFSTEIFPWIDGLFHILHRVFHIGYVTLGREIFVVLVSIMSVKDEF